MEEKNEKPMTADQTTTDQTAEDPAVLEQEALDQMTVEEGFEKIEEILRKMDSRDIPLEESFGLYEEGMKLLKFCNERISRVEKQVMKLDEDGQLKPLDEE